jgi:protein-S-isoprenylcysteine O-methyltransferase Ste14
MNLADVFAQIVVIFYPGVFVFWLIVHSSVHHLRRWHIRAEWVAIFAWLITAVPLLMLRARLFSVRWSIPRPLSTILASAGILTFILAVAIFITASRQMPWRTLVGLPEFEPDKNRQPVLRSGIYARTRNPIYLGHWLLVFSAAALTNYAANWVGFVLDCIVLPLLIRAEERELLARYGRDFAEYMQRVPRFFPSMNGSGLV